MSTSDGAQFEDTDVSEFPRRTAIWVFPAILLLHAIFLQALAPGLQRANLVAAALGLVGGFAFRWVRRATTVIAVIAVLGVFTFPYLMGIAAPLSYLAFANQRGWMPLAACAGILVFAAFMILRVRASLSKEWSQPLEKTPGVQIATNDWILWRYFGRHGQPVLSVLATALLFTLVPVLSLSRGRPDYLAFALVVGPVCVAALCVAPLASWIAFYVSVRRWEAERGIRLRFPALRRRRTPQRKQRGRGKSRAGGG